METFRIKVRNNQIGRKIQKIKFKMIKQVEKWKNNNQSKFETGDDCLRLCSYPQYFFFFSFINFFHFFFQNQSCRWWLLAPLQPPSRLVELNRWQSSHILLWHHYCMMYLLMHCCDDGDPFITIHIRPFQCCAHHLGWHHHHIAHPGWQGLCGWAPRTMETTTGESSESDRKWSLQTPRPVCSAPRKVTSHEWTKTYFYTAKLRVYTDIYVRHIWQFAIWKIHEIEWQRHTTVSPSD